MTTDALRPYFDDNHRANDDNQVDNKDEGLDYHKPKLHNHLTHYNPYMELAALALNVEGRAVQQMGDLQEVDVSIQKATGAMGMLLEQFNTALQKAKQEKKECIELTEGMLDGIEFFRNHVWPEMEKRHEGILDNYPSPFPPEYGNLDNLKTDEAEKILSRLTYLTNLDASHLKLNSFTYQELIHKISQMTSSMTEFFIINKQNWTKNQRTS